jgi:hypothetical protein
MNWRNVSVCSRGSFWPQTAVEGCLLFRRSRGMSRHLANGPRPPPLTHKRHRPRGLPPKSHSLGSALTVNGSLVTRVSVGNLKWETNDMTDVIGPLRASTVVFVLVRALPASQAPNKHLLRKAPPAIPGADASRWQPPRSREARTDSSVKWPPAL